MVDPAIIVAKVSALAMVGAIFAYGLKRNWEGVYLLFGLVFLLGSCSLIDLK